jgi:hypothetical protein
VSVRTGFIPRTGAGKPRTGLVGAHRRAAQVGGAAGRRPLLGALLATVNLAGCGGGTVAGLGGHYQTPPPEELHGCEAAVGSRGELIFRRALMLVEINDLPLDLIEDRPDGRLRIERLARPRGRVLAEAAHSADSQGRSAHRGGSPGVVGYQDASRHGVTTIDLKDAHPCAANIPWMS